VALCGHVVRPWLTRRLALRAVFVSLDWYETGAEEKAAEACRALPPRAPGRRRRLGRLPVKP